MLTFSMQRSTTSAGIGGRKEQLPTFGRLNRSESKEHLRDKIFRWKKFGPRESPDIPEEWRLERVQVKLQDNRCQKDER